VTQARDAVGAVWRVESARIVGSLARYTGDFSLAEDVAQEALAAALVDWPRSGVPRDPAAWLMTVARRRAIDAFRRRAALDERYVTLGQNLREGGIASGGVSDPSGANELPYDPDRVGDDVLALLFIACHPLVSPEARVALTLRTVGGLSSDEIARAFLVSTATVQARITRAKKTISAAQIPFDVPPTDERRERLGSVLSVIYVIFTEGSTATSGDELIRFDLAGEAIRLARVLTHLVTDEPEAYGLLALLELTAARFPARTRPNGEPVLLDEQDRRRWDPAAIRRGRAALAGAGRVGRGLGAYGLQAAIAERHAVAPSVEDTDWQRIVVLYEALSRLAPSPIVDLNRAVAVSMTDGPAKALAIVDDIVAGGSLAKSHLLPSVRGELLRRLGRTDQARSELSRAAELCGNTRERGIIERKLREMSYEVGVKAAVAARPTDSPTLTEAQASQNRRFPPTS